MLKFAYFFNALLNSPFAQNCTVKLARAETITWHSSGKPGLKKSKLNVDNMKVALYVL